MCGICGVIHADKDKPVDRDILSAMNDLLAHRGPDDSGILVTQNIGLAHRRLSIIDIEGGRQPMCNEDGTIWLIYNGELYNYQPLRHNLEQLGHTFKTKSDTEVIIHAWEEYGEDCLKHFRGMFAFGIYDRNNRSFFAARDRLGIKPFYYSHVDGSLIFASELKSLMVYPGICKETNHESLYAYLRLRYVPGPETILKSIKKLSPGHYLSFKEGHLEIIKYWDLTEISDQRLYERDKNLAAHFEDLLEESVRMRMMSDVPLGAFLSGGIDSSVVVAKMAKFSANKPIQTFSVGYENDDGVNEFHYANLVAQKFQTDHHECRISSKHFYDFLPRLTWHLDEPIADAACIPLYFLSEFAKEYVTVVLSGEGADEVMGGYGIYQKMLLLEKFYKVPKVLRNVCLALLSAVFVNNAKIQRYISWAKSPLETRYKGVSTAFSKDFLSKSCTGFGSERELDLNSKFSNLFAQSSDQNSLNQMMYIDLNSWLPDDLLVKADKMTMAASQELRVPFLDHKLVEFCYGLPQHCKINKEGTKYLLRKLGKALLPVEIVQRPKRGFPVPIFNWLKGELNQHAKDVLLDASAYCRSFLETKQVIKIMEDHIGGKDNSELIWNLLILEFWHKNFLGQSKREPG